MLILIKGQTKQFFIEVQKHLTILELKTMIKEKEDIEQMRQKLVYDGQVMENTRTIESYYIEEEDTIHMIIRPSMRD